MLSENVSLDFPNGVLGQILADFGHDPFLDVGMEGTPQIGKGARRRDNDERRHVTRAHDVLQSGGHALRKAVLLEVMPVGLLHAAVPMRPGALDAPSGSVGSLFVGWWVLLGKHLLGLQIGELLVALIAQEQGLAAVTDEDHGVVRYCDFVHV